MLKAFFGHIKHVICLKLKVWDSFVYLTHQVLFDSVYTQYSSTIDVGCQFLLLTLGNYLVGRPVVLGCLFGLLGVALVVLDFSGKFYLNPNVH